MLQIRRPTNFRVKHPIQYSSLAFFPYQPLLLGGNSFHKEVVRNEVDLLRLPGFGQIFRSFALHRHHYSPQTIEKSASNRQNLVTITNIGRPPNHFQNHFFSIFFSCMDADPMLGLLNRWMTTVPDEVFVTSLMTFNHLPHDFSTFFPRHGCH